MVDSPKLSAALLDFAKPLLDLLPPDPAPPEVKSLVQVAVLVWNAVALEKRGHQSPYLEQAHQTIQAKFTGPTLVALAQILSDLEAAKRSEVRPDLRLVTFLEVFSDDHGQLTVRAGEGRLRDEGPLDPPDHDAAWKALYLAAMAFRAIEPWNWMGDAERIGVADPESGEVGWAVVMGGGGEFRGLALYLGDAGLQQLDRMIHDEELDAGAFGQDALVLGFVDRELISPEEQRRMKRLSFKFRGRGEWPQIDSHARNRMPLPPTDPEVVRMETALRQVLDVAVRANRNPDLVLPDEEGRRLVRVPTWATGPMTWREERRPVPKAEPEPIPAFDQVRAERLRGELSRSQLQIECDLFPGIGAIKEPGRPAFAPAVFLAVDAEGGAVVRVEMHEPEGRGAWAQEQVLSAVEALGAIPAVLLIARPSLARLLEPLARLLGIHVERVEDLPLLEEARGMLDEFLLQ